MFQKGLIIGEHSLLYELLFTIPLHNIMVIWKYWEIILDNLLYFYFFSSFFFHFFFLLLLSSSLLKITNLLDISINYKSFPIFPTWIKPNFFKQMLTYAKTRDNIWINNEGSGFHNSKENIEFALILDWTGLEKYGRFIRLNRLA